MIRIQNIPVDVGDGEDDLWRCGYKLMTESAWNEGIQLDNKRLAQVLDLPPMERWPRSGRIYKRGLENCDVFSKG